MHTTTATNLRALRSVFFAQPGPFTFSGRVLDDSLLWSADRRFTDKRLRLSLTRTQLRVLSDLWLANTQERIMNCNNDDTMPRIMECETDWKVSPYGDAEPDRDCYWVETHEEALLELENLTKERMLHNENFGPLI